MGEEEGANIWHGLRYSVLQNDADGSGMVQLNESENPCYHELSLRERDVSEMIPSIFTKA